MDLPSAPLGNSTVVGTSPEKELEPPMLAGVADALQHEGEEPLADTLLQTLFPNLISGNFAASPAFAAARQAQPRTDDEIPDEQLAKVRYVSTDGNTTGENATLEDAVQALNKAGGGTITVTKGGSVEGVGYHPLFSIESYEGIIFTEDITITAEAGTLLH